MCEHVCRYFVNVMREMSWDEKKNGKHVQIESMIVCFSCLLRATINIFSAVCGVCTRPSAINNFLLLLRPFNSILGRRNGNFRLYMLNFANAIEYIIGNCCPKKLILTGEGDSCDCFTECLHQKFTADWTLQRCLCCWIGSACYWCTHRFIESFVFVGEKTNRHFFLQNFVLCWKNLSRSSLSLSLSLSVSLSFSITCTSK